MAQARPNANSPNKCGLADMRFTERRRRNFLRALAETYDDDAALAASGLSWPQVCELRRRFPDFAEGIEQVIAAGYDRLEAALLRAAGLGRATIDAPLAQTLLKQRRTGKTDAAIAERRAKGPAPTLRQMKRAILDEIAPLRAAARGGLFNDGGRGAVGAGAEAAGTRPAGI